MSVAIVVGEFHKDIAEAMVAAATQEAEQLELSVGEPIWIPGSYEAPLTVQTLLEDDEIEAVIVLGYIEKGETLHGEVMGHVIHSSLVSLQLQFKKPVGLGIIGPGATVEQAQVRKENAAVGATRAVARSLETLSSLS